MTKKEIKDHVFPWLISALISSVATFALLLIFIFFPGVKKYLTVGDDTLYYLPFLGASAPLEGTPLTFIVWSSVIYWGVGFARSKWAILISNRWNSALSNILLLLAIGGFFFVIPLLSVIWALAIKDWNIAIGVWSYWGGNHGPWRHLYHLRKPLNFTFFLPLWTSNIGLFSFIFKPNILALVVISANFFLFFALIGSHHWLVD
jgi:hypothetical protein